MSITEFNTMISNRQEIINQIFKELKEYAIYKSLSPKVIKKLETIKVEYTTDFEFIEKIISNENDTDSILAKSKLLSDIQRYIHYHIEKTDFNYSNTSFSVVMAGLLYLMLVEWYNLEVNLGTLQFSLGVEYLANINWLDTKFITVSIAIIYLIAKIFDFLSADSHRDIVYGLKKCSLYIDNKYF